MAAMPHMVGGAYQERMSWASRVTFPLHRLLSRRRFDMTDRWLRVLLFTVLLGSSPLLARATTASPSFAVRVEGSGPAMVLIPGFVSSGAVWDDVVAHYRTRYTCHVLTLPGFAGQPAIAAPVLPRVRDEIIEYIRARKLGRPVLVGHSLGGFLALWVASTAPDVAGPVVSVDGVPFLPALMDPSATIESAEPQARQMTTLYASLSPEQLAMQSRMAFAAMMSDATKVDAATRWAAASDPKAAAAAIGELMTTDLRGAVAAIRTPVLLVPAMKTFASMPGGAARAGDAYAAQMKRVPVHEIVPATGALHFVMFDDLPFLLETMDAFLVRGVRTEP
jgi:pimeloyl-ACP methyl ester carboxylesterase